jgi:hypothetical protein
MSFGEEAPRPGHGDVWAGLIQRERSCPSHSPRVVSLMEARRLMGIEKYGTPLQFGNGRHGLRDLIEEVLDTLAYAELVALERPEFQGASETYEALESLEFSIHNFLLVLDEQHPEVLESFQGRN